MNTYEKQVAKQIQTNLGSGYILEGTQEGTVVVVGANMLAIAYVETSDNTIIEQEYILLNEILSVKVDSSAIIFKIKSDDNRYIHLEPNVDINTLLGKLLYLMGQVNKK